MGCLQALHIFVVYCPFLFSLEKRDMTDEPDQVKVIFAIMCIKLSVYV